MVICHGTSIFSTNVYTGSSRTWPLPDFVIVDADRQASMAGEFKPPNQSKREYLTGLGQAFAYTRDFSYSMLVVPTVADDGYEIARHITSVLEQTELTNAPVGLICYDPKAVSPTNTAFQVLRSLAPRVAPPKGQVDRVTTLWAKWRDMSLQELGRFLELFYEEGRNSNTITGTVRGRAFDRLWDDMTQGRTINLSGTSRQLNNTPKLKGGWSKNFRNFPAHLGWCYHDGKLTAQGLAALHLVHQYGYGSRVFLDHLSRLDFRHFGRSSNSELFR